MHFNNSDEFGYSRSLQSQCFESLPSLAFDAVTILFANIGFDTFPSQRDFGKTIALYNDIEKI